MMSWLIWVETAVALVVVGYLFWKQQHERQEWNRKRDQQTLQWELQRDLHHQEQVMLSSFRDLQRQLAEQRRILNYVSRRLS